MVSQSQMESDYLNYNYKRERLRNLYAGRPTDYAVVTGSSDGIGRVIALQLAKYGFNVLLVSRSEDKLQQVMEECLKLNPSVHIQTAPIDFSKATPQEYEQVF